MLANSNDKMKALARYRTKKGLGQQSYDLLKSLGYNELFVEDTKRPIYSCDVCYEQYGKAVPEIWEYRKAGFMRS